MYLSEDVVLFWMARWYQALIASHAELICENQREEKKKLSSQERISKDILMSHVDWQKGVGERALVFYLGFVKNKRRERLVSLEMNFVPDFGIVPLLCNLDETKALALLEYGASALVGIGPFLLFSFS